MASSRPLCLHFSAWDRHTNKFHPRRSGATRGEQRGLWTQRALGVTGEVRESFPGMVPQMATPLTCTIPEILLEGCQEPCLQAAPASQSPLLPDAVSAEPNASSATPHPHPGAASDPPRLLQGPAFLGRLSQKTNSKLFCQSKLRASHPAPGATTLPEQLWSTQPPPLLFSLSLRRK